MRDVSLEDYRGTSIEKGFKETDIDLKKAIAVAIDNLEKAEGKECSPKMKRCISDVMRQGKSESSAVAICKVSVEE